MTYSPDTSTTPIIPALRPLYALLSPVSLTILRVVVGIAFVMHGWPKIQAPFGAAEMVGGIGFQPAWLWSLALSATEFFGGILLILGLLTRPAALATTIVLLVTVWFHWVKLGQGWSGAELSIIWASATLFLAVHGGGRFSLDRLIGREI